MTSNSTLLKGNHGINCRFSKDFKKQKESSPVDFSNRQEVKVEKKVVDSRG